jgi:hypothetical protein
MQNLARPVIIFAGFPDKLRSDKEQGGAEGGVATVFVIVLSS